MIGSTVLADFFVPVFFVVFQRLSEWLSPAVAGESAGSKLMHGASGEAPRRTPSSKEQRPAVIAGA